MSTDALSRQAILSAAATRVSGTPEQAALQMRAAVQVADGLHLPFVVWPEGLTHTERRSWLEGEIARVDERLARQAERIKQDECAAQ
ncbi:hypothetical protein [Pseudomonas oryzihabitans]|uniref:hypothetical protein n=1 Tax=Pseudomonas oryzihabitans TaxID=47885 RepID=UPI00241D41B4|nr:hypothetical protein [Pseudomonas oryzihabitans]